MSLTSGTRAYGRDFTIAVEMQTYTRLHPPNNTHNIVVWKYELSLQYKHTARLPSIPNKLIV